MHARTLTLLALALVALAGCAEPQPTKVAIAAGAKGAHAFHVAQQGTVTLVVDGGDRIDVHLMAADQAEAFRSGGEFVELEQGHRISVTSATVRVTLAPGDYAWGFECLERDRQCTFEMDLETP